MVAGGYSGPDPKATFKMNIKLAIHITNDTTYRSIRVAKKQIASSKEALSEKMTDTQSRKNNRTGPSKKVGAAKYKRVPDDPAAIYIPKVSLSRLYRHLLEPTTNQGPGYRPE